MKKIYSLIALVAMFVAAVNVSAQKYHLVQKATTPEVGVTYALYNPSAAANNENAYASSSDGLGLAIADDSYLWQFEATGEKSDDGFDLYVLKSVDKDAYWQEDDFENNLGLDGYDIYSYAIVNCKFGEKATACRFTILQANSEDSWRAQCGDSNTDGFVLARNKEVQQEDGSYYYYKLGRQNVNIAFEPWNGNVTWQLWTVEENGPKEKLQELVDRISMADITYQTGNDPGMYSVSVVEAYNAALQAAMDALFAQPTPSDDEFTTLYENLLAAEAALATAVNPIKEGYYFIVSGYSAFFDQQGVEKGVYVTDVAKPVRWMDFNQATAKEGAASLDLSTLKTGVYVVKDGKRTYNRKFHMDPYEDEVVYSV